MGITIADLPDADPVIEVAYDVAIAIVNRALNRASPLIYTLAVYNLGGDNIINFAQDQSGSRYFTDLRDDFKLLSFVPGVVTSTGDQGTSTSLLNPDFMKEFTMANLQNLKTPYGRQYLDFAQDYGTIWGLS